MNVVDFANRHMGEYKIVHNEVMVKVCPICGGGSHNDKWTFSINIDKGVYKCLRGKCNVSGTFSQLCKDYGETSDSTVEWVKEQKNIRYKKPKVIEKANSIVVDYLNVRKISRETITKFKIGQEKNSIVFRYYLNGEHIFNKYRYAKKVKKGEDRGMRRDKDTKPIFYGMDNTTKDNPLVITEGESDCLSVYEAGYTNVVSLPSGSSDLSALGHCWDWLKDNFTDIIIWVDDDEAGEKLTKNLIERLIEFNLYLVDSPEKDANLVLFKHGKSAVLKIISNAQLVPVEGIIDMSEIGDKDYSQLERVPSAFQEVNKQLGGFEMGMVTILTGKNGGGKSTYLGNEILNFGSHGYPVCIYSGELPKIMFKRWLTIQAAGKVYMQYRRDDISGDDVWYVPIDIKKKINNWYSDKFKLIDIKSGVVTDKQLLNLFKQARYKFGCKVFIIDNLLTTFFTSQEKDFNLKQTLFIAEVSAFAKNHDSHVIIVAHPRKIYGEIRKEDIGGSGNITNLADNVITFHRNTEKQKEERECDNMLEILKSRELGIINHMIPLSYDPVSKRFFSVNNLEHKNRGIGWE